MPVADVVAHVVRARPGLIARWHPRPRGGHLRLGRHPDPLARRRLPRRVAGAGRRRWSAPTTTPTRSPARLHAAGSVVWGRSRDHQQSATIADLFTEAGLEHDPELLTRLLRVLGAAHRHRPRVPAPVRRAARDGPQGRRAVQHDLAARVARRLLRARRRLRPDRRGRLHERDPVDQAVRRGRSAPRWRPSGVDDPAGCVYVGDRLFDDVWGARTPGCARSTSR